MAVHKAITTKRVLWTSLFVDALDVFINVVIAIVTGSAVMIAEALQGLADLSSVGLLLIGFKRSKKHNSSKYPFGYGKEQYFWAIVSSFLIIGVTATLSFYTGLRHFIHPHKLEFLAVAYVALAVSVCTNGYAVSLSLRKLLGDLPLRALPKAFIESSDVAPRTTLVLDAMGTLAAAFGLSALITYGITGDTRYDGLGAMIIGVLLLLLALVLLFTTKGLVTGRSASAETELVITKAALKIPQVRKVLDLRSMMMGPEGLLINIEVHLQNDLSTDEVEKVMDEIKQSIQDAVPGKVDVNVEPETPSDQHLPHP